MERRASPYKRSRGLYPFVRGFAIIWKELRAVLGLALSMFIALFAFGHDLLGWTDTTGQVQLGLFMSFLFGIICGYRTRG
jgi:hypothetical protein